MKYKDQLVAWLTNVRDAHSTEDIVCREMGTQCPAVQMACKECVFYSRDTMTEVIETLKGE